MTDPTRVRVALGAATAALVGFLSFSAGGFFPGTTSLTLLALLVGLVVWVMTTPAPGAAIRSRLVVAVLALALLSLWQLLSADWSHAPGRAALASNLTLLYVVALALGGLVVDRPGRVRALVLGILAGLCAACVAGLLSRTLPHVFPVAPGPSSDERLNFPLTYWNAVGLVGSAAIVLCLGLTASRDERPWVRVATAAAVPPLAATVLLTFSRGSIAAGIAGAVLMVLLAPRRQLLSGLLATVPTGAVAAIAAYQAEALAKPHPTGEAAVSQGRTVLLVVIGAALAAAAVRALLARFVDPRLDRARPLPRRTTAGIVAGVVVAVVAVALAVGAPHRVDHAYDRFVHGSEITTKELRDRLTDPGNNGRLDHWRVAVDAFRSDRATGAGAGTYQVWWNQLRKREFDVLNAHSLYLETLGEGGVVGLALLVLALLTLLGGTLARVRGPDRALWATIAGAMVAWLLEAGVDWIWQMPAASIWVFLLGGAALARPRTITEPGRGVPGRSARLVAGVALLIVAITPGRIALSQAHLDDAIDALRQGDCRQTVSASLASAQALGARAEPYELLAYCDTRLGFGPLASTMIDRAIQRDPRNWEYRYDRALVLGAQGRDPRGALAEARRLNPLENRVADLQDAMDTDDPRTWRRRALGARLLLPGP